VVISRLKTLFKFFQRFLVKFDLKNDNFISNDFGFSRGTPIDRYYLNRFLKLNKKYIKGVGLEFGSDTYLKKYNSGITNFNVFTSILDKSKKKHLIKGDLSDFENLPLEKYDCIVCTNVLNFIYDIDFAVKGIYKMLKKNGTCLVSLAGFSTHISRYDMDRWGDYWRVSKKTAIEIFEKNNFKIKEINSFGNVYTATAQMKGFCVEDIEPELLLDNHNDYQIIITLRIKKR
jgi:SAM-dependent methyltransferase